MCSAPPKTALQKRRGCPFPKKSISAATTLQTFQSKSEAADFFLCFIILEDKGAISLGPFTGLGFTLPLPLPLPLFPFFTGDATSLRIVEAISLRAEERSFVNPCFTSRPSRAANACKQGKVEY